MATSIQQQTAVAIDAAYWDVGGYRIWESTEPGILLYVRHQLVLASDPAGRPVAAVTRNLQWSGSVYEPVGGSALLGFAGVEPEEAAVLLSLQDSWTRVVRAGGYTGRGPGSDPRYLPLPIRDAALSAHLDSAHATVAAGQAGATLRVDLTAAGAVAWAAAINNRTPVEGIVRLTYAYPQLMPRATATVQVHGRQVYSQLAAMLTVAADGSVSGTEAEIRRAWAELVRAGAIEVSLTGSTASALASARDGLVEQARENLFDTMFVDRPGPVTGAPVYVLRWTRAADVPDVPLMVSVEGWTWLTDTLEASVAELLLRLNPGAIQDVNPSVSVPVLVAVEGHELVESVVVSLDFGDIRAPEVVTFDKAGGSRTFTVTTARPDQLAIRQRTRVVFREPSWPVLTVEASVSAASHAVVITPVSWVRRHEVYAFVVKDGRIVVDAWGKNDMLAVNVRYENAALPAAITASTAIDPGGAPLTVTYPVPPDGPAGRCTVGVVGSVGGQVLHGSCNIGPEDREVFLLIENGLVRFVTESSMLPESDPVGQRLLAFGGRPLVRREIPRAETHRNLLVSLDVALVAQPTTVSCWAAVLAMVVNSRDRLSLSPADLARRAGLDVDTPYAWPQLSAVLSVWGLVAEASRSSPPEEWAALLREWGPIGVVEVEAPYHAVVVRGITGDGTPDGTWVQLYNPWPPNVGSFDQRTFTEFYQEFNLGSGSEAAMVHG